MKNQTTIEKTQYKQTIAEMNAEMLNMEIGNTPHMWEIAKTLATIAASAKGYLKGNGVAIRENGNEGSIDGFLSYCAVKLMTRRGYDLTKEYPNTKRKLHGPVYSWMGYANEMVRWWLIEYNKTVINYDELGELCNYRQDGSLIDRVDPTNFEDRILLRASITPKNILYSLEKLPDDFDPFHYEILYYLATKKLLYKEHKACVLLGARYLIWCIAYSEE